MRSTLATSCIGLSLPASCSFISIAKKMISPAMTRLKRFMKILSSCSLTLEFLESIVAGESVVNGEETVFESGADYTVGVERTGPEGIHPARSCNRPSSIENLPLVRDRWIYRRASLCSAHRNPFQVRG